MSEPANELAAPAGSGFWIQGRTQKHWLAPCPFCGGEPYQKAILCGGFDSIEKGAFACKKCGAMGPPCRVGWADGLARWNARIPNTSVSCPTKEG